MKKKKSEWTPKQKQDYLRFIHGPWTPAMRARLREIWCSMQEGNRKDK